MANELAERANPTFDSIRRVDDAGQEFWLARDLARVLEYSEYRHFLPVIERAKEACRNSGQDAEDHFEDILDMVDIGSGAGLPGIVVAAMRPQAHVMLVEPMERRVTWLLDVVERTGLTNVEVRRARAQELDGAVEADAVTARAVASLDKLYRWTVPLVRVGGHIVAMKGARAGDELAEAAPVMRKLGLTDGEVHEASTIAGTEPTRIVTAVRGRGPRVR